MQANAFSNQKQLNANIAPSLICADLCNLARDIDRMESIGCQMLHIDIIDGYFSPSMPIGIDTIRQLRQITTMQFDAHIMAKDNTFFVNELLSIGVDRLCFQIECEPTPGALLQKIHNGHSKAGIALAPTTSLSHLEYVIEECDFVLLMQIDPGYAFLPGIQKRTYMNRKLLQLNELIAKRNPAATIEVDGRVSIEDMPALKDLGVSTFVSGTSGFFRKGHAWEDNWATMVTALAKMEEDNDHA